MTLQGQLLGGRYLLGAGGMGQVYRARDRVLERTVAVKVLSPATTDDLELVARFGREARAAAALNHPNIVTVFDSGADGDLQYLVMEYVEGQSLAGLLRQEGVLEPRRAAEVGRQVCQALAAAHAAGLVHRDITPGNVLVDPAGLVKVADFGIAKLAAATTMTGEAMVLGTAAYLAPEQAQGRAVDGRSDLYSLGCVLYALVTGAPPFAGDSPVAVAARHLTEPPIPPSHHDPRVGPELQAVILTALAKAPADRYQSAAAMAQDLDRVIADAGAASVPLADARGGPPTDRLPSSIPAGAARVPMASTALRRPGWVPWALVGALGIVALVAVALGPRGGDPPAAPQPTRPTTSTAAPPSTPARTTPPTQAQAALPAALANLAQVISAGQQQGSVDNSATDLLKQAEEVLRAADEGKAKDVDKKLQDLQRKTDDQIDKGKIRGPAVGQVRQAVVQFSQAVRSKWSSRAWPPAGNNDPHTSRRPPWSLQGLS
jgi:serine/threonine-protein kinase